MFNIQWILFLLFNAQSSLFLNPFCMAFNSIKHFKSLDFLKRKSSLFLDSKIFVSSAWSVAAQQMATTTVTWNKIGKSPLFLFIIQPSSISDNSLNLLPTLKYDQSKYYSKKNISQIILSIGTNNLIIFSFWNCIVFGDVHELELSS